MSAGELLKTAQALSWKVPISRGTLNLCLFPFSKVHIVQVLGTEATDYKFIIQGYNRDYLCKQAPNCEFCFYSDACKI